MFIINKLIRLTSCSNQEDILKINQIATQSYREHYQYLWKDKGEKYIKDNYSIKAIQQEMATKHVALYLIEYENESIGFIKLNLDSALENHSGETTIEIERIYLLKKATNKGIGEQSLTEIEELAQQLGKQVIWLKTMDSSNAVKFYQKCGYEICGETKLKIDGLYPAFQKQWIMRKHI